jgi:hypothetical protein
MTAKLPIGVIVPFGPERWPQFRYASRHFLMGLKDLARSGDVRLVSYAVVLDGAVIQRPDPWEEADDAVTQMGADFFVETLRTEGEPRPPNAAIRAGFQIVKHHGAELVVICYPEIVVPAWCLEFVAREHVPGHRITAPLYAVSERRTRLLLDQLYTEPDEVDFYEFEEWVHSDPDFAVTVGPLGIRNIDADGNIHHLNFTAATVGEWESLGLLPDTDAYAMNENWLREREVEQDRLPTCLSMPVYHLWHPKVLHGGLPRSVRIERIHGGSL